MLKPQTIYAILIIGASLLVTACSAYMRDYQAKAPDKTDSCMTTATIGIRG